MFDFVLSNCEDIVCCACCKARIQFVDNEVTRHVARKSIHNDLCDLERQIERINRMLTLTIEL